MYMCILSVFQKCSYMFYKKARQTALFAWLSATIQFTACRVIPLQQFSVSNSVC